MARRAVACSLALLLVAVPALSAPAAAGGDAGREAPGLEPGPREFTLALGGPDARPGAFSLGLGGDGDDRDRFDRVTFVDDAGSPALTGLAVWSLGTTVNLGLENGRPRVLLLGPLQRDWDDLDGWEKFGVVLQTAAAAAAAVHFAGKLVDKLK